MCSISRTRHIPIIAFSFSLLTSSISTISIYMPFLSFNSLRCVLYDERNAIQIENQNRMAEFASVCLKQQLDALSLTYSNNENQKNYLLYYSLVSIYLMQCLDVFFFSLHFLLFNSSLSLSLYSHFSFFCLFHFV